MTPVLSCNVCSARGYLGERQCPNCHGFGFVELMGERVLGWRRPLDRFAIEARRAAVTVNRIINAALLLVAALALGEMLFGLFMGTPLTIDYWVNTKNSSLLFFWFGCFCGFILLSRNRAARYEAIPVLRREYKDEAMPAVTPPGWEAVRAMGANLFINVSRSYSPNALLVIENAVIAADRAGYATLEPVHLFVSLLEDKEVTVLFARAGLPVSGLLERAERADAQTLVSEKKGEMTLSATVQSALLGAYADAYANREEKVEPGAVLLGISDDPVVAEILTDLGITSEILANVVAWSRINRSARSAARRYRQNASLKPTGNLDRAMTAIATPMLDRFSHDLTRAARFGRLPFLVDREAELAAVFRAIEGGRTSVVLVGEPGVGKDAIVYGIAERMVEEDVPAPLQDKRLVSLSISDLIAGAAPEEVDGRLMAALNEVGRSKNIVIVIDNIDALADVAGVGVDLAEVFATELSSGYFYCIATAYPSRYKKIEGHPLGHALERVDVKEPEQNAAIRILMSVVGAIEYDQRVFFTYQAIERAVVLSTRYLHDRFLPEKAIEILKEAAQLCRREKGERSLVSGEDVAVIISEKSHVPVTAVTESERGKLLNMEKDLHARVIGQDEAVSAVAAALRRARAELRAKNRPISAFLFLGPTGVGKTELAKTVAAVYFGAEQNMIRLDMSEYQEASAVHRLIGVPGATGGGLLTEAIRKEPFTLLLLDEFEKAHPDILNIFLQVMDDGRLTDNEGRTVDFTNCIIVATSNAGSQYIQDSMRAGLSVDEIKKGLLNTQLKGIFKPELLNRFDGVIVFKPLTKDEIEQVAWLMMGVITDELAARGITFRATDEAVAELATIGFDPVFGARPMRRAIQEKVENALADALLKEKIERRDTVVLEPGGVINIEKGKKL
jgi:ATP-dependent Clp protease ATP-binding subunit ClpC